MGGKHQKKLYNSQLVLGVAIYKGHNCEYDLQQDIILFDVSFFSPCAKIKGKVKITATA